MAINLQSLTPLLTYLKDPWLITWIATGLFAIFLPHSIWASKNSEYYDSYGYYKEKEDYYEQQQEYYNKQQEYYEKQQNGEYYYGEQTYYEECSWMNWACRKRQYYFAMYDENGGNGDEYREEMPMWFIFLGGETEEMQRWKEENTNIRGATTNSAGLKFVYALTILLFVALLGYGAVTIGKKLPLTNLVVLLVLTIIFGLMNIIMNAQGVISADDRDLEDSYYGWYGQTGVLLVYTNYWMMIFSSVFCVAFLVDYLVKMFLERKDAGKEVNNTPNEESGDYYAPAPVGQTPIA